MNVMKVLVTSAVYPFVYFKETVTAITVPVFLFSINWAFAVFLDGQVTSVNMLFYIIQLIALSMILTNCVCVALGQQKPQIYRDVLLYSKVFMLFVVCLLAGFVVEYLLTILFVNAVNLSSEVSFSYLQMVLKSISNTILFWASLVVPQFI